MEVYFSVHVQKAMAERGVSYDEVRDVVLRPEVRYGDSRRGEVRQRDDLAVVVKPVSERGLNGWVVVTVLWRRTEQWTNDEMKDNR